MIEYKTIIRIIIMYSIGNAPFREQNLTAYRLRLTLHGYIITASYIFCNSRLTSRVNWGILICERFANLK